MPNGSPNANYDIHHQCVINLNLDHRNYSGSLNICCCFWIFEIGSQITEKRNTLYQRQPLLYEELIGKDTKYQLGNFPPGISKRSLVVYLLLIHILFQCRSPYDRRLSASADNLDVIGSHRGSFRKRKVYSSGVGIDAYDFAKVWTKKQNQMIVQKHK